MDNIFEGGASGTLPIAEGRPWVGMPRRPNGIYVPRFRNVNQKITEGPKGKFIRGYGYQGRSSPEFDFAAPGFGKSYKDAVHQTRWNTSLAMFGESLARKENFAEIDKERKDAWGIPVSRFQLLGATTKRRFTTMASNRRRRCSKRLERRMCKSPENILFLAFAFMNSAQRAWAPTRRTVC